MTETCKGIVANIDAAGGARMSSILSMVILARPIMYHAQQDRRYPLSPVEAQRIATVSPSGRITAAGIISHATGDAKISASRDEQTINISCMDSETTISRPALSTPPSCREHHRAPLPACLLDRASIRAGNKRFIAASLSIARAAPMIGMHHFRCVERRHIAASLWSPASAMPIRRETASFATLVRRQYAIIVLPLIT